MVLSLFLFFFFGFVSQSCSSSSSSFAVVGYVPEWRFDAFNWDVAARHVTHIVLFSLEPLASGELSGVDRFPRPEVYREARSASTKHGAKLLVCFGGNGRSSGFSGMVRNDGAREKFVENVVEFVEQHALDGVDLNWEYPGFAFGRGYLSNDEIAADYQGLYKLAAELKKALGSDKVLTMAYYIDGRQEMLLRDIEGIDLFLAMAYDQQGANHSPFSLTQQTLSNAQKAGLPIHKVCLGLPFYGRDARGDWNSYEDILKKFGTRVKDATDVIGSMGFNGKSTIRQKVAFAKNSQLGGVMIWEAGQDCRLEPVTRGDKVHVRTCPDDDSSLLVQISKVLGKVTQKNEKEL